MLFRIREAGLFHVWFNNLKIENQKEMHMLFQQSAESDNDEAKSLNTGDLFGVFSLLVFGLTLSGLIFVTEIVCKVCQLFR